VRDHIQGQRNFFPELDEAGEAMAREVKAEPQGFFAAGRERLAERHGISVRVVPAEVLPDSVRRYDHHRRRLMLSELLGEAGRAFSVAYQLALAEHDAMLNAAAERGGPPDGPTRRLLKVSLANYLAAAAMMPYEAFREACERTSHDILSMKKGTPHFARRAFLHAEGRLGRQHLQALRRRLVSVLALRRLVPAVAGA
jgi:predicted transcriptional regulator